MWMQLWMSNGSWFCVIFIYSILCNDYAHFAIDVMFFLSIRVSNRSNRWRSLTEWSNVACETHSIVHTSIGPNHSTIARVHFWIFHFALMSDTDWFIVLLNQHDMASLNSQSEKSSCPISETYTRINYALAQEWSRLRLSPFAFWSHVDRLISVGRPITACSLSLNFAFSLAISDLRETTRNEETSDAIICSLSWHILHEVVSWSAELGEISQRTRDYCSLFGSSTLKSCCFIVQISRNLALNGVSSVRGLSRWPDTY